MNTVEELRQLADVLSKATPGPWNPDFNNTLVSTNRKGAIINVCGFSAQREVWSPYNAEAICAARNSEDLLRQAADELERLQKVVEQVKRLLANRGDGFIVRFDEQNGGLHLLFETIDEEGNPIDLDIASVDNAHELAAELEARP